MTPTTLTVLSPGARVFLDTNVLVYTSTPTSPWHTDAVAAMNWMRANAIETWISRQVLREYLATMTRPHPGAPPPPLAPVVANATTLAASLPIAEDGPGVTGQLFTLLGLLPSRGKQVHDANIVATMLAHGIPNLLTNNVSDFTRFSTFITIVPLVPPAVPAAPASPPGVP